MNSIVLVVEDEVLIRSVVSDYLRDEGFQVIEAANADEALDILESGVSVDILFTDIRMPGSMNGRALANRVARDWREVRVLVTSGYSGELISAPTADGYPVIAKPYRPKTVLETIRSAMRPRT